MADVAPKGFGWLPLALGLVSLFGALGTGYGNYVVTQQEVAHLKEDVGRLVAKDRDLDAVDQALTVRVQSQSEALIGLRVTLENIARDIRDIKSDVKDLRGGHAR